MKPIQTYTCPICAHVTAGKGVADARHCGPCYRIKLHDAAAWLPLPVMRVWRSFGRGLVWLFNIRDSEILANFAVMDALIVEREQTPRS